MNNNQRRTECLSRLEQEKVKSVGFFETVGPKLAGYFDGKRNLPQETPSGWTSPYLDKEVQSYNEFECRMWGRLQIEAEEDYVKLGHMVDAIELTKQLLKEARVSFAEAEELERDVAIYRKKGESNLTEEQVSARRSNESVKRLAPFKDRVSSLENKLASEIDNLSQLYHKIVENNNSTRLICNRVRKHVCQRIDTYWNAALLKHYDKEKISVVPCVEIGSHSEAIYMEPHESLMQKVEMLIKTFINDEESTKGVA